jgi:feruloyl esterase
MKSAVIAFAILIPLMVGVGPAFSEVNETACLNLKVYVESLTDVTFNKPVTNVSATWYPANPSPTPPAQPTPEYCQVTGWIWPEIQFQVSLPTAWNGRYINSGGGGWDGSLVGPLTDGLVLGYATSGANGGYMGANWPPDPGSFGLKEPYFSEYYDAALYPTGGGGYYGDVSPTGEGNPYACQKVVDFGIRHLKETPLIAKEIINHYYGNYPEYSYFSGNSCGGKEGQVSAQKLYYIYDGFYIGCPLGGHVAVTFRGMWDTIQGQVGGLSDFTLPGCTNWFFCPTVHSTYKAQAHHDAVYNKCDGVDGLVDGLIDDPRKCNFDALTDLPACADENDIYSTTCFTLAQRQALKEIYAGPHNSHGKTWYVGQPLSAEYIAAGFFGLSSGFGFALNDGWAAGMFANIALDPPQGPDFDMMAFDWDKDPKRVEKTTCTQCYDDGTPCKTFNIQNVLDAITISPNPAPNMGGLEPLYRKGGKIIQHHGWSDALVSAFGGSSQFYESVMKMMGPKRTKHFYKLYMVPGAGHCGGGIGYYQTWNDGFGALVDWVEDGIEPGAIIGARSADIDPYWPAARTRPICPYPEVARYSGNGSIDDAANFMCVPPVEVRIEPEVLNLNRKGVFTAFITIPRDYRMKDWNLQDVTCEGVPAKFGFAHRNVYIAKFDSEDFQDLLTPGESVTLTVKGVFSQDGKDALVQASDTVRVIEHDKWHKWHKFKNKAAK